jgi:hypothetical protein
MSVTDSERKTFGNVSNKVHISIHEMYQDLSDLTGGFPVVVSGGLCYQDGAELHPLATPAALFAWINKYADVYWQRGGVTKEEFFEGLRQTATKYDWATPYAHFPEIEGVLYTCKRFKATNTGALKKLVARFAPATVLDRQLILALILTLFWGGPPGKRPTFVITSADATDKNKVAKLVGGVISVRTHADPDRVLAGLLSPSALPLRVVLIDNVKTYRLSSEFIESLITCENISGHKLYHGHATRPNFLTWVITVNGPSFSKDMSDRSIVIQLERFKPSPRWFTETVAFIEANRAAIVADVRWHLQQPAKPMQRADRWPVWADQVLSKLDEPDALLQQLEERRAEIDEDDQDAEDTVAHIRACIKAKLPSFNPETGRVRIPALVAARMVRDLKTTMTDRQAALYLKQLGHPRLHYYNDGKERGYNWIGDKADENMPPTMAVLSYEPRPGRE